MTAWILLAGRLTEVAPHFPPLPPPKLVVAADGGARHAAALGVKVNAWVGDFDSSAGLALDAPRHAHPRDKNHTDAELAVELALEAGARELVLLGAFGGRFDHALGNALLALRLAGRGVAVTLCSGDEWGWPLLPGAGLTLALPPGATLSVLPLGDLSGLSIGGVRWPLERADVSFGASLTLSNRVLAAPVRLTLARGRALVVASPPGAPNKKSARRR